MPLYAPSKLSAKKSYWNACLDIDLDIITHNLQLIQQHIGPQTRIMPILKSEGYGTCNITLAHHLWQLGVDIVGLAYLHEAIVLREAGIEQQLFVINVLPQEIPTLIAYGFEVGVGKFSTLKQLEQEAAKQESKARIHLHLDTGMSRFGASYQEAQKLWELASCSPFIQLEGLMSHFAASSTPEEDTYTFKQAQIFKIFLEDIKMPKQSYHHISNSGAILRFPHLSFNMVRLGLSLYGIHTQPCSSKCLPLKNALTLKAKLIFLRTCEPGDSIGYNRQFVANERMPIGVVSIGYSDGIHLSYNRASVYIKGCKAPIVGNICMDCFMVDLRKVPPVRLGDEVMLFGLDDYGREISPEEFAKQGNSIPHELISGLGPRIFRHFKKKVI